MIETDVVGLDRTSDLYNWIACHLCSIICYADGHHQPFVWSICACALPPFFLDDEK